MKVVQAGTFRCFDELIQRFAVVAMFVPFDSGLRVIAIGSNLHGGARSVFVERADATDELLFGKLEKGGSVTVDIENDEVVFRYDAGTKA